MSLPHYMEDTKLACNVEFENSIIYDNQEYKLKVDLGKEIYEFIYKNEVVYLNSLRAEYKEVLDLYMKESVESFPTNVELKPWQNELMKYIKPHDREIIWVVGKDGNEGKSWFQKYVKSVFGTQKVVS